MFCWSCGHENPGTFKYCGECGKSLFKPERGVHEISGARTFPRDRENSGPAPSEENTGPSKPDAVVVSRESAPPKPANPLTEEPRVVHEKPVTVAAEAASTIAHP